MADRNAFSVMALIAAYNEADIIGPVVRHLIDQQVSVYLLDHGSTDGTIDAVTPFLGRGLVRIERFPEDSGGPAEDAVRFAWESILRRKEVLADEIDAEWFIHQDADEFRESPWPDLNLRDAIRKVDAAGYNAVDFELLNFRPVGDDIPAAGDIVAAFPFYEPAAPWDRLQIRCWKKTTARVDLASSGGHEAIFPDRRVFPLRFVLRHYPIRGQRHGERKVFAERIPRFDSVERQRAWHRQYDGMQEGDSFVPTADGLTRYDPTVIRLNVALNAVESIQRTLDGRELTLAERDHMLAERDQMLAERDQTLAERDQMLAERDQTLAERERTLAERDHALAECDHALAERDHALAERGRALAERDHALAEHQRKLAETESALTASRLESDTRGREIDALHESHRLAAARFEQEVAARQIELDGVRREVASAAQEIERLRAEVIERELAVAACQREIADSRRQSAALRSWLDEVFRSRSWRWTSPLRKVYGWLLRG